MKRYFEVLAKVAFLLILCVQCGCSILSTDHASKGIIYGPDPNREIDESEVTYYVSLKGDDSNDGKTRGSAFRTMQKAVDLVKAGETVLVTKGVYKKGFWINKHGRPDAWISVVAEPGVEIRGSDIVKTWKKESNFKYSVYSISRPKLGWQKPDVPIANRTEQVFVNGKLLNQVIDSGMLKPKDVFYVDDAKKILYVCLKENKDPNIEKTEVTYRNWAIAVGGKPNQNYWRDMKSHKANRASYVRVDGFKIRNIACFSRQAAIQIRGTCHDIVIENCDTQWINTYGICSSSMNIFSNETNKWIKATCSDIIVRNNRMSNCGWGGGGGSSTHYTIEKNIMDRNNYKGVSPWAEGGACKTGFSGSKIVIRHNIARNNKNHGLWFDYGATGCVIENNFVYKSIAGGILNEVTPEPKRIYNDDGTKSYQKPTLEDLKNYYGPGTIIRNNVVVGTMAVGGGGINNSSSNNAKIYNNVVAYCDGSAFNVGGGPKRKGILGNFRNRVYSNIAYDNYACAAINTLDFGKGMVFDNIFKNNLFLNWRDKLPVKIRNVWSDEAAFEKFNKGAKNYYHKDRNIFRNPKKFDFTITDPELVEKIGFDSGKMRLDWSEYYVEPKKAAKSQESNLVFTPVNLNSVFNRGLTDEVADDGKGGWTDQGQNDMSRLTSGRQIISAVPFEIGPKAKGSIFLKNNRMKEGPGFPDEATVPVNAKFEKLFFLYGAAWCGDTKKVDGKRVKVANTERARFIVKFQDGTQTEIPILYGEHILDWWHDPTSSWQTCAALNDNDVYVAWQGPNRAQGMITTYYLNWRNPDPEKQIKSVTISGKKGYKGTAFFFLGLTGANEAGKGKKDDKVFQMDFNGNVDAVDAYGRDIEVKGVDNVAFKAAKFTEGVKGKGIIPLKRMRYDMPPEFPYYSGTVSIWLKADDYFTEKRIAQMKNLDYKRVMWPFAAGFKAFTAKSKKTRGISSYLRFIMNPDKKTIAIQSLFGGVLIVKDITSKIKPEKWFNITVTWGKSKDGKISTQKVYIDGKFLTEKQGPANKFDKIERKTIFVGVPGNGGQPWCGVMDELTVWDKPLSGAEIAKLAKL